MRQRSRGASSFLAVSLGGAALGCAALGCAGAGSPLDVVKLNAAPRALAARAPETVTVFTAAAPTRPFVEIALIQARRRWGTTESAAQIFDRVRVAAAQTGCDGLVLLGEANTTSGWIWPSLGAYGPETHGSIETFEGFRATCIAWRDEGEAPEAPPSGPPSDATPQAGP
jgi:hypothetical protein